MKRYLLISVLLAMSLAHSGNAKQTYDNPEAKVSELLSTSTTWDGNKIVYPKGEPEVTVIKLQIDEGFNTGFHCHPVANFGYVINGELEIELYNGPKKVFKQGESFSEVINSWHRGEAVNGPVELVITYIGEKGTPFTILPSDSNLEDEKCEVKQE